MLPYIRVTKQAESVMGIGGTGIKGGQKNGSCCVITAVGIDVSKSKSTVAVRRPGGEIALRPFEVHHTNSDLKKLASTLKKLGGDIRIVMEHTSTYWRPIALTLKEAVCWVSGASG